MHPIQIIDLTHSAETELRNVGKVVGEKLKPRPGPYALFYHISFAEERICDIRRILNRLIEERKTLTATNRALAKVMPESWPPGVRFPPKVQRIMKREDYVVAHMKTDFESLYMFGDTLLDQWSKIVAYMAGLPKPGKCDFTRLVKRLEDKRHNVTLLTTVWNKFGPEMLWLYYWLRAYRNRFIVHIERPWQRTKTYRIWDSNFQFYTPSPPGWINKEDYRKEIESLLRLLPRKLQVLPHAHSRNPKVGIVLQHLFENIGAISLSAHRERVLKLVQEIGISTPTFQILGGNLLSFVMKATKLVLNEALNNLEKINLGRPRRSKKVGS